MMRATNRRPDPGSLSGDTILLFALIGLVVLTLGVTYAGIHIGYHFAGLGPAPTDPWEVLTGVLKGTLPWPAASTWAVVGLAVLGAGLALLVVRRRRRISRVDAAARWLGRGDDVAEISAKTVAKKAERLGVTNAVGVPIGTTVATRQPLFGSWEDMHIDIWGPRTGKTTSRAIPAILAAPGAVLVTSNKRDVVDATRDPRATIGQVWIFDPQGISGEEATWWWNPLSYVTDEVKAAKLAEHFASSSRDPGARTDAYFDPAAQDLLAGLLLAAALDHRPITDVYKWLTRPTDETAVDILRDHGVTLTADLVAGVVSAPEKQRGGVYGTAQQMAACLTNRYITSWITPQGAADPRCQFSPEEFVRSTADTLYSLSKEGRGTAGPLVTALTVAIVEAAEELAAASPGGRLGTPLLGVLDEAANVCR